MPLLICKVRLFTHMLSALGLQLTRTSGPGVLCSHQSAAQGSRAERPGRTPEPPPDGELRPWAPAALGSTGKRQRHCDSTTHLDSCVSVSGLRHGGPEGGPGPARVAPARCTSWPCGVASGTFSPAL